MRISRIGFFVFNVAVDAACTGFGLGSEEWEYVEYLAGVASENPLPRDAKQVLFHILQLLENGNHLAKVAEHCPYEALTLMAQSLTSIEQVRGETAMFAMFDLAHTAADRVEDGESQLAWAAGVVPLMRGRGDSESCLRPGALKVYIYNTGRLAERSLHCSAGMEGVEVFFHRFFLASSCRTEDPVSADVFLVPFYNFCYQNEHIAPGNETAELDALNIGLVQSLAHHYGTHKDKHIFLFPHEFWDFPSWRAMVADAHLLVVEANPLEWTSEEQRAGGAPRHCLDCFNANKDVVLPGHTDYWTTRQLVALQRPWQERRYSICYHGAFEHALYDSAQSAAPFDTTAGMTRAALGSLRHLNLPRMSVGGHLRPVRAYYDRITDCQYCFVPKGVGFTNGRLMESFFSGCIPVILSDAMVVPFDTFLQWPSFSLKVPMPRGPDDAKAIASYLLELPASVGLQMHEELAKHRCWFDYGPAARSDCSPYEGVLKTLTWQHHSRSTRRFWSPGDAKAAEAFDRQRQG